MKSPQIFHTHYLQVLYASHFFLCRESEQMYHNSVVNSLVNIYLISLLAQPRQFQIRTPREAGKRTESGSDNTFVGQNSLFFSPLFFIFY